MLLGSPSRPADAATVRTVIVDEIHARGREQARQPPGAVARAAGRTGRRRAHGGRSVTRIGLSATQKPIDDDRPLPGRRRRDATASPTARSSTSATPRQRDLALERAADAAGGGDVERPVGAGLPAGSPSCVARASHHAGLRQHAADGRTRRAPPRRAARPARRSPPITAACAQGSAARRRAAAQARRAEGAGRDRVARAGARHRRRRPRLPARLAALDRHLPAARRPLRPRRRRHRRRRGCSRRRATSWSNARRCSTASAAASSTRCASRRRRSTCWRSRSSPRSPCREWDEDELFDLRAPRLRRTPSCRASDFDAVVRMLADGFTTRRGRAARYCTATPSTAGCATRRGARLTALTSGGTIPETGDYAVVLEPQAQTIGTRQRGLRGREPGRRRVPARQHQLPDPADRTGRVRVEDAAGAAPNIPFWLGEAPGRSDELSIGVSRLRDDIAARLAAAGRDRAASTTGLDLADRHPGPRRRRREPGRRLPPARPGGARRDADAATASSSNASSTNRAACSS